MIYIYIYIFLFYFKNYIKNNFLIKKIFINKLLL